MRKRKSTFRHCLVYGCDNFVNKSGAGVNGRCEECKRQNIKTPVDKIDFPTI